MGEPADDEGQHEDARQQPPQHLAGRRFLDDGGGDALFWRRGKQPYGEQKRAQQAVGRHRGERELVVMGGDAIGVAGEHDQHLGQHGDGQDLADGGAEPVALGAQQSEPKQDQRAGVPGRHARAGDVGGRRRIAKHHPVDAEVKSVQVLEDGCAAEQDERETDEPGEGPQAAECKAEQPDACGDGSCGGIRRHAVKMGEERLERGEIEMPAREHERPGGANHQGAQARQTERHPHGARHRQCHSHWDLNHSPSSPPISRGRSPGEVGRSSAEGP